MTLVKSKTMRLIFGVSDSQVELHCVGRCISPCSDQQIIHATRSGDVVFIDPNNNYTFFSYQ